MKLVQRALLTACVAVTVTGLVGASPAAAATVPSQRQVTRALLTGDQLAKPWHQVSLDTASGNGMDVSGCNAEAAGPSAARSASRAFQYAQQPAILEETVSSFTTLRRARLNTARGIKAFTGCSDLTLDGHPWTVQRIPGLGVVPYADQQAIFELRGFVTTANGDVPMTIHLAVARMGHHQVMVLTFLGGPLPDEQLAGTRDGVRVLLFKAMRRATTRLGV